MDRICHRCEKKEIYGKAPNSKYCKDCKDIVNKAKSARAYAKSKARAAEANKNVGFIDPKWLKPRGSKRNGE